MGMATKRPAVTAAVLSSHRGRAVTAQDRNVVRGNNKSKGSVAGLGGLRRPLHILPFNFCCSVYTLCLFGMNASFQTCFCVCVVSEGRKEGVAPF